jgi:hypothetical protein
MLRLIFRFGALEDFWWSFLIIGPLRNF